MVMLAAFTGPCSNVDISGEYLVIVCDEAESRSLEMEFIDNEFDEGMDEPLLGHRSYIRHMGSEGTVDAEVVMSIPRRNMLKGRDSCGEHILEDTADGRRQFQSTVMPPCEFDVSLPKSYVPGQCVRVKGPQGFISIRTPCRSPSANFAPGSKQRVRLAPLPEFRVEVPPGVSPGSVLKFAREDGTEVSVTVPQDAAPGSIFDVLPPALMVQVPQTAMPGDLVVFSADIGLGPLKVTSWCRAPVPAGSRPEEYFPVRVPVPQCIAL